MNDLIVRHTDGLGHVNLADMDMDAFREWLWPGVKVMGYMVEVKVWNIFQMYAVAFPAMALGGQPGVGYLRPMWYRIWLRASSEKHAKRKAMAMVRDYLAKSHSPCTMTTGGNHGKE